MAGNKINAKAKGKEDKGKGSNKSVVPTNDEPEETDFSLLRKPILTSITGFAQARKIFDKATEELKSLLSDECDLIYECKVCRNLFRSLANFISHKRVYCQNKFNSTVHGHFIKSSSTVNELIKIRQIEEGYQESLKEVNESEAIDTDELDDQIPLTKDLTMIIEKIAKKKDTSENISEEPQVTLHKIPNTAVAVFQNVDTGDENESENMRTQVNELDNILSRNVAVLQNDGKFSIENSAPDDSPEARADGVIQISDDEENGGNTDNLKCLKCNMQFSTLKTLKFHLKYKHLKTRIVYPCPDCLEIFSTSWSVYRHLFKVHRKTAAQIRRLRDSIIAKAFKMNNPPAFYEKRKNNMKTPQPPKITEEERLDQENQAWMDNMECDGEVPRCGGCGRSFERRAALAAHTHTCQPRSRALRRPEGKRIEIQIRKDYNKGPAPLVLLTKPKDQADAKTAKEVKEPKEIKEEENLKAKTKKAAEPVEVPELPISKPAEEVNTSSVLRPSVPTPDEQSPKSSSKSPEKAEDTPSKPPAQPAAPIRLPFAQHSEKSNLMALRQRIIPDIELETLRCKKCNTRFNHIQDLYDHVAKHYNWMRYACKLCNFKHYNFEKLPEHVKIVHKLKGDKDFYFSTVKALDGTEASELSAPVEEPAEAEDTSPKSRRPSRCSSDSSRLSDDSSSSSVRVEGSRKRKTLQSSKVIGKRRKSVKVNKGNDDGWDDKEDSQSSIKDFEENSSDMDDAYVKVGKKRAIVNTTAPSRRPVRRKTKTKNEDFEYDLSNLLKMEAQGYRDSQTVVTTTKSSLPKNKKIQDNLSNYEMLNKESCGALVSLSRKAVENAKAHIKTVYVPKEKIPMPATIFVRPLPRAAIRVDKLSPKKDIVEEKKDISSTNKEMLTEDALPSICLEDNTSETVTSTANKDSASNKKQSDSTDTIAATVEDSKELSDTTKTATDENSKDKKDSNAITGEKIKPKSINIPAVVPIKFRRQSSLEVIKNPMINKNITDFTGMKTKILLIKPMNRNKDGIQTVNTPLKFQTIKLKETNKSSSSEDKPSDQVVVVKVPKVDCITRTVSDTTITKVPCEKVSVIKRAEKSLPPNEPVTIEEVRPNVCEIDLPKVMEISNSDINGDVRSEKSELESMKCDENYSTSFNDISSPSKVNCDDTKTNTKDNTVNDTTSEQGEFKTDALQADDSPELACVL